MKFRPRLQLKLVEDTPKKTTKSDEAVNTPTFTDHAQLVYEKVENLGKLAVIGLVIIIAADTARQALVKVTPEH